MLFCSGVDDWMNEQSPARKRILNDLRAECRHQLFEWAERVEWGMPGYGPADGTNIVSFDNELDAVAFYAGPATVERFLDRLGYLDCRKGCVRYPPAEAIDLTLVRAMLRDIRKRFAAQPASKAQAGSASLPASG